MLFATTLLAGGGLAATANAQSCYESGKSGTCETMDTKSNATPGAIDVDVWGSAGFFWVSGKAMPNFSLSLGQLFWGEVGVAPIWSTDEFDGSDDRFLGAKFGLLGMIRPYSNRWVDLRAGIGADIYYLAGINGDVSEASFVVVGDATAWATKRIGFFGGVRVYPLATTGLELGTDRNGDVGSPLLFETGIRFR